MNHVNILEAKIVDGGEKNLLEVVGQIRDHLVEPLTNVLVTNVINDAGISTPIEQGYVGSFEEFSQEIYNFRKSYEELIKSDIPYSKVNINIRSVAEDTD